MAFNETPTNRKTIMFTNIKFLKRNPSDLEAEIARILALLSDMDPKTDEAYGPLSDQLAKLYKLKDVDNNSKKRVSGDALVGAAASIAGIVAVIGAERIQVLSARALGLIVKAKV